MMETCSVYRLNAAPAVALLCGLLAANPSPAVEPLGRSESQGTAQAAEPWVNGFWLHRRSDNPGPDESTWRILKIDGDGDWTCAEFRGEPRKPTKLEVCGRGTGAKLALMPPETAKFYVAGGSPDLKPKPAFSLVLPLKDGSTLHLGALVRGDDGSIEFHNFSSIHWSTRYVQAAADERASLDKLLENAPAGGDH